jgi:anti-sigma factor RsiW
MQTWLGAYVLDALEPDETEKVRQHLAGCAECWDEVARLSWIPPLLQAVDLADVEEISAVPQAAPPVMLERLLHSVQTVRRFPRRRVVLLAAAAAIVIVIGALTAVGVGVFGTDHVSRPIAVSAVAPHSRVSAAVTMSARNWGTELHLKLSWVKPGQQCSLIARSRDGRRDVAATWVASYKGTASVPGATAIPLGQLSRLDVVTSDGHLLVRIPVPHRAN